MINKKILIISISILFFIAICSVAIVLILQKDNKPTQMFAEDLTVEFNGLPHKIVATTSDEGSLFYEYVGIDNDYNSALEPSEAGEYDVKISYKPFKGDKATLTKNVRLTISLPYTIDDTGTEISNYVGNQKEVVLPTRYKNKNIESLADNTFKDKDVASIKIPNTNFFVNPNAFKDCAIEELFISENTKLCDGLYPNGMKIEFYGNPQTVFEGAFGEISGIAELTLPSTIRTIEENALSKIKIEKLSLYSDLPLSGKNLSTTINFVQVNSDATGKLADSFFENCINIEKIEIMHGINTFGKKSFYNCNSLNELIINSAPQIIEENCFDASFVLKKLVFDIGLDLNRLGLQMIEDAELKNCEVLPLNAFQNCFVIKKITLPNTIKNISSYAFSGCSNLVEIDFPDNLETIQYYAFENCVSLVDVSIPTTVETILDGAFSGCLMLETIMLPEILQEISPFVFYECTNLETIVLPNAITIIGNYAFYGCISLNAIELPLNLEKIGSNAFASCGNLKALILPHKISSLGQNVFRNCDMLKTLTISSEVMPEFDGNIFTDLPNECTVFVSFDLLSSYSELFSGINFVSIE